MSWIPFTAESRLYLSATLTTTRFISIGTIILQIYLVAKTLGQKNTRKIFSGKMESKSEFSILSVPSIFLSPLQWVALPSSLLVWRTSNHV